MKRILAITLALILMLAILTTTSCASVQQPSGSSPVSSSQSTYPTTNQQVQLINESNRVLSTEEVLYLNSVWGNAEWIPGQIKARCDYRFESNGITIGYADDIGIFNDYTNNRCIILSKEQTDYMNTYIIENSDP